MLLDTLFTSLNSIMESYIDCGYDENEDYFEYFIEIITRVWMLIDKINLQDIANIRVYKLFAIYTFYYNNCRKNICHCDVNQVCKLCQKFNAKLVETLVLKRFDTLRTIKNKEWLFNIDISNLIKHTRTILDIVNIKYTEEDNIETYNEEIDLDFDIDNIVEEEEEEEEGEDEENEENILS